MKVVLLWVLLFTTRLPVHSSISMFAINCERLNTTEYLRYEMLISFLEFFHLLGYYAVWGVLKTDVSELPIGLIFKGQDVQEASYAA
jgi:hypothetical protein